MRSPKSPANPRARKGATDSAAQAAPKAAQAPREAATDAQAAPKAQQAAQAPREAATAQQAAEQAPDVILTASLAQALDAADITTGTIPDAAADAVRVTVQAIRSRRFDAQAIELATARWADDKELDALNDGSIGTVMACKRLRAVVVDALASATTAKAPADPAETLAYRLAVLDMAREAVKADYDADTLNRAQGLTLDTDTLEAVKRRAERVAKATAVGTRANQPTDKRSPKPINPTIMRAVEAGNGWATVDDVAELHITLHGGDKTGGPGATWKRYEDALASGTVTGVLAELRDAGIVPEVRDGKRGFARADD